jgi:hypothetical protein
MTNQNLWDTATIVLRGKFIVMSAYIKRTERSQINGLMLNLKLLEKQEQAKFKSRKRREIIKIRKKTHEIETKTNHTKNQKTWFFGKINKIDKSLAYLSKIWREKIQISKIRNKRGDNNKHQGNPGDHQRLL